MWRDAPGRFRLRVALVAGAIFTAFIFLLLTFHEGANKSWKKTVTAVSGYVHESTPLPPAQFHILIPVTNTNANLCKVILATTVLGYPIPTLYNWESTGEPLMAKVTGALDYMRNLENDDDLILIMDGYDEWVQVSPKILIDRYHEVNERGNKRLGKHLGQTIDQRIVFASQKRCWPGVPEDLKCSEAYESPLPTDIYGPNTDKNSSKPENWYLHMRQKYLNAGFIVGRAKEMRAIWERAEKKAEERPNCNGHDQNVFARIWGEQNHMRQPPSSSSSSPVTTKLSKRYDDEEDEETEPIPFTPNAERNYEFGLGIDYTSSLSLPTVFSEYDADWIIFSNRSTIDAANQKYNITNPPVGVRKLDKDIAADPLPFRHLSKPPSSIPANASWFKGAKTRWEEIPLFTHLWTGVTPAVIHHNAHRDDLKERRYTTWHEMWFQPFARVLVNLRLSSEGPALPRGRGSKSVDERKVIAVDKYGREWYAPLANDYGQMAVEKGRAGMWGVRTIGGAGEEDGGMGVGKGGGIKGWQSWGQLCNSTSQEEVFRDGLGEYGLENGSETR